jgi:hypothetical protein
VIAQTKNYWFRRSTILQTFPHKILSQLHHNKEESKRISHIHKMTGFQWEYISRVHKSHWCHGPKFQFLAVYIHMVMLERETSAMTVSMHCKRPLWAAPSTLDIAEPISSQAAAWAPSTGSKSRDIVFEKYWSNESFCWDFKCKKKEIQFKRKLRNENLPDCQILVVRSTKTFNHQSAILLVFGFLFFYFYLM